MTPFGKKRREKNAWSSRWDRLEKIPGGAQGSVSLVRPIGEDRDATYVLKELKSNHLLEPRRRMQSEVAALHMLDEVPGVARCVDSNAHNWAEAVDLFLVMERVEGEHVRTLLSRQRPTTQEALSCVISLLRTAEACHQREVVHRDIKPENVVLQNSCWGSPVLVDFGVSFCDEAENLTRTGEGFGNRFLALPELAPDSRDLRTPATDRTSCIGLLFLLLTGVDPRVLRDSKGLQPHERPGARDMLANLPPAMQRRLNRVFSREFRANVQHRFTSDQELIKELEKAAADQEAPSYAERLDALIAERDATPEQRLLARSKEVLQAIHDVANTAWAELKARLRQEYYFGCGGSGPDFGETPSFLRTYKLGPRNRKDKGEFRLQVEIVEATVRLEGRSRNLEGVSLQTTVDLDHPDAVEIARVPIEEFFLAATRGVFGLSKSVG